MFEELDKIVKERCRLSFREQMATGGLTTTKQVERLAFNIKNENLEERICETDCCKCNKAETKQKAVDFVINTGNAVEFNIIKSGLPQTQNATTYQKLLAQFNQVAKAHFVDPIPEGAQLVEALKNEVEIAYDDHVKDRNTYLEERNTFLEGQRERLRDDVEYRKTTEIVIAKREIEALEEVAKVEDEKQKIVIDKAREIRELNEERQEAVALEELKQETTVSLQNRFKIIEKTLTDEEKQQFSPIPVRSLKSLEKREAIINNIAQLLNIKDERVNTYIEVKSVIDNVDDYLLDVETGVAVDERLDQVLNDIVEEVGEEFE